MQLGLTYRTIGQLNHRRPFQFSPTLPTT